MFFVSGKGLYGKVDNVDGAHVATLFRHVWWLPIFPTGSWLMVGQGDEGRLQDVAIGWSWKSIAAGYLRVWSPFWLALGAIVASNRSEIGDEKPWGVIIGSAVALVLAWTVLARVSPVERARRRIYAEFAGSAVDVALLYGQREGLRERLHAHLRERFMHANVSYRGEAGPEPDWFAIARDPEMTDASLLRAALTLARLDLGEAQGVAKAKLRAVHDEIWAKLSARGPENGATHAAPASEAPRPTA